MPLLDHFHPPLFPRRHWESFHVTWAGAMADALNEHLLPDGYFAEEHARAGSRIEGNSDTYPDEFEVRVYEADGHGRLVAAVVLVSPANKDCEAHRWAFANRCVNRLSRMVSLIVVDVVTSQPANLHAEIMRLYGRAGDTTLPLGTNLYAVAYQPFGRPGGKELGFDAEVLEVGRELPARLLTISTERPILINPKGAFKTAHALLLDLEGTYTAACNRRRLT